MTERQLLHSGVAYKNREIDYEVFKADVEAYTSALLQQANVMRPLPPTCGNWGSLLRLCNNELQELEMRKIGIPVALSEMVKECEKLLAANGA